MVKGLLVGLGGLGGRRVPGISRGSPQPSPHGSICHGPSSTPPPGCAVMAGGGVVIALCLRPRGIHGVAIPTVSVTKHSTPHPASVPFSMAPQREMASQLRPQNRSLPSRQRQQTPPPHNAAWRSRLAKGPGNPITPDPSPSAPRKTPYYTSQHSRIPHPMAWIIVLPRRSQTKCVGGRFASVLFTTAFGANRRLLRWVGVASRIPVRGRVGLVGARGISALL